jgi:AraC-like DNA-binding protein
MVYRKSAALNSPIQPPQPDLPEELRKVSVVEVTDPTAAGESIELVHLDVINLDPEQFEIKRVSVPLEECCLIYTCTNAALKTRAHIHEGFECFLILGPQAHGSIDGTELHPYSIIAARPGSSAQVVVDRDYESVTCLIPPGAIDNHLDLRGKKKDFVLPDSHEVWHPAAEVARNHFELGARIAEAAGNSPEIFNGNHWARYGAQVELMDSLLATIESCDPEDNVDTDKKGKSYSQIVQACEDYTLNLDGRRPYMSELCAAASVSERTVQNAFRDIMGMSPLTYLHRLRLHRARDELRKASSGSTTVTDVAMNWGFWHFGEFSRTYKNCFGEVPSRTLKEESSD